MKSYPKYGCPGFHIEYFNLHIPPKTSQEVSRQLECLGELENHGPYANTFMLKTPSKRRKRLLNMWWALYRQERRAEQ